MKITIDNDTSRSSNGADAMAPHVDWSSMCDSDHFVQFYANDPFLLRSLGGYIGTALNAGETAIVVATPEHGEGLVRLLENAGIDTGSVRATARFVELDAAETLAAFMVDGMPDPKRFGATVGRVFEKAAAGGQPIRAFGEMVALLWAEGNRDGAIRLEELWNDLGTSHRFTLFCAYPMSGFQGDELADPLQHVCSKHSRVIPDESYSAIDTPDQRMRVITRLQQRAQSLAAEIVERKQVEAELLGLKGRLEEALIRERALRAEAESANRLKDEFLTTVSHELRTPLTSILGWAHLLRAGGLDPESIECAGETIERNAQLQAQLVNDLLDVSSVITGRLQLAVESVDPGLIIRRGIDSIRPAADARNIDLLVCIDPSVRPISADPHRLRQIVWNLLSNAVRFTPSGGRIDLHLQNDGSILRLTVSDTGAGIDPEFLPFVFDRFRQADSSITRQHGGLGLGLSIVRHLVELHGGSVAVESAGRDAGTTFTILLPTGRGGDERAAKGRGSTSPPAPTPKGS